MTPQIALLPSSGLPGGKIGYERQTSTRLC